MPKSPPGPTILGTKCLSASDLAVLNNLIQSCSDTKCLLDGLAQLGIDTSSLEADNQHDTAFSTGLKAMVFPHSP